MQNKICAHSEWLLTHWAGNVLSTIVVTPWVRARPMSTSSSATSRSGLVGDSIQRTWGLGEQTQDQFGVRHIADGEFDLTAFV